jgi:hypothetical protein
MKFSLPPELAGDVSRLLGRAYVTGGPDGMPSPGDARLEADNLSIQRASRDSGAVCVPWSVNDNGPLMIATGTLIERALPYDLLVELARGKVNQLRTLAADWETGGLVVPAALVERLREVGRSFARMVCQENPEDADTLARTTLRDTLAVGTELVGTYVEQVFRARHQHQSRLETSLSCGLSALPTAELAEQITRSFNAVRVPFLWPEIEGAEGQYHWDRTDMLIQWASAQGLGIIAGPVLDFSRARLPEWLGLWKGDLQGLSNIMLDYLEAALQRYKEHVRVWHLTAGSNTPGSLGLEEDDVLWLTARLTELARQMDPKVQLVAGISQPWGEYLVKQPRTYTPFGFADMLMRSRVTVSMLDLEIVMGVENRGSYERDLMEISRLLDLYALLGMPLRLTLGYPSQSVPDSLADPDFPVDAIGGAHPRSNDKQAAWVRQVLPLAACKPYVVGVAWTNLADNQPHQFPHCGLVDAAGQFKPALAEFANLRQAHLR